MFNFDAIKHEGVIFITTFVGVLATNSMIVELATGHMDYSSVTSTAAISAIVGAAVRAALATILGISAFLPKSDNTNSIG